MNAPDIAAQIGKVWNALDDRLDRTESDIECLNRRLMGIIEALDHIDARLQNIQQLLYDSRKQSQTSN